MRWPDLQPSAVRLYTLVSCGIDLISETVYLDSGSCNSVKKTPPQPQASMMLTRTRGTTTDSWQMTSIWSVSMNLRYQVVLI